MLLVRTLSVLSGGPGYTAGADINTMNNLITHIEPLLFKYRVNVAFYGHNHVVQRHSAVFNKTVIQHSTETLGKYCSYQHFDRLV